jgi:ribosomal-protein-alanine N-acetyltransferase
VERRASGTAESLAIVDATNEVVGTISLQSIIRGAFQSCTVGYWLAESAQGQGLATQALREAVDLAFGDLRLHRVQAETMARNVRSQRVLDRAGFVRYGHAETYMHIAGEWQDNLLYGQRSTCAMPPHLIRKPPVPANLDSPIGGLLALTGQSRPGLAYVSWNVVD